MATSPNFTTTPKVGISAIATANTARDGTGTMGTVFTAGASGSLITEVVVQASAATTAGMVRLFIHDGTNARLFDEFVIPVDTVGNADKAFRESRLYTNLSLPTTYSLRASTAIAETFNVIALGGDY